MQSWNHAGSPNVPRRLNVLILDGGGVRGVSSLMILQELMLQINKSITSLKYPGDPCSIVKPQDIFGLVAGTSTGGLISLMLGKLGMDVTNCLQEYSNFSEIIFKRKQFLAIGGFARSKYSGLKLEGRVRDLLQRHEFDEDLQMTFSNRVDEIACAVVCRKYESEASFKDGAVCICSLPCDSGVRCAVWEAARATSAAPTYFPAQEIEGGSFADGGLQFNNPSHAIFDHYSQSIHVAESKRASPTETVLHIPNHGDLDFKQVRIVNLGTGTKARASSGVPSFLAKIVPGARTVYNVLAILNQIAVDSEDVVRQMRRLASIKDGTPNVKYERFNASGVGNIKMDKYKEIEKIRTLTQSYLTSPEIQAELNRVGKEIARDFLHARRMKVCLAAPPASQEGKDQVSQRPQASITQTPRSSDQRGAVETPSTRNTQPSMDTSGTGCSKLENAGTSTSTSIESSPNQSGKIDPYCG